jgi:hypothetical protein
VVGVKHQSPRVLSVPRLRVADDEVALDPVVAGDAVALGDDAEGLAAAVIEGVVGDQVVDGFLLLAAKAVGLEGDPEGTDVVDNVIADAVLGAVDLDSALLVGNLPQVVNAVPLDDAAVGAAGYVHSRAGPVTLGRVQLVVRDDVVVRAVKCHDLQALPGGSRSLPVPRIVTVPPVEVVGGSESGKGKHREQQHKDEGTERGNLLSRAR